MIIDQSLRNAVRKNSSDFRFNNFEKIINELNFQDGMSGNYIRTKTDTIQVEFDNSWVLFIMEDGTFTMLNGNGFDKDSAFGKTYDEFLKYMENQGIRKDRQCEYKDAELYIIDFGG